MDDAVEDGDGRGIDPDELRSPAVDLKNMPTSYVEPLEGMVGAAIEWLTTALPDALRSQQDFFLVDAGLDLVQKLHDGHMLVDEAQRAMLVRMMYPSIFATDQLNVRYKLIVSCRFLLSYKPKIPERMLCLDHRPLLNAMMAICDEAVDWMGLKAIGQGMRSDYYSMMRALAIDSRRYFSPDCIGDLRSLLLPVMTVDHQSYFRSVALLSIFTNFTNACSTDDAYDLIVKMIDILGWMNRSIVAHCIIFDMIARSISLLTDRLDAYLPELYNEFVQALDLRIEDCCNPLSRSDPRRSLPGPLRFLRKVESNRKILARCMARIVIYSLNDSNFHLFRHLMQSLKTFAHPCNNGPWSGFVAAFLDTLSYHLAKRKRDPKHIPFEANLLRRFMEEVTALASLALYSSTRTMAAAAGSVFRRFALIDLAVVEAPFRQLIARTLLSPVSPPERRTTCLNVSVSILQAIVDCDWLHDHIFLSLDSLNPSQPLQASAAIRLLTMFFYMVDENRVTFVTELVPALMHRVFNMCEYLSEYKKTDLAARRSRAEFENLANAMFMVLPDDLHRRCADRVLEFINSRVIEHARRYIGVLCSAAARSSPQWTLAHFVPPLIASIKNASPNQHAWIMYHLSCTVRRTGSALLPYLDQLIPVITSARAHTSNLKVRSFANKLAKQILKTLTEIYIDSSVEKAHRRNFVAAVDGNLHISWHVPSSMELCVISYFH